MIPDYCEAITAYRSFDAFPSGLLMGESFPEPWPTYAPMVGRCGAVTGDGSADHVVGGAFAPPPVVGCSCGVHALKSQEAARERAAEVRSGVFVTVGTAVQPKKQKVWGAVKLWGRIIEHTDGYRAEFAYPSELFCESAELAQAVARMYGVPCHVGSLPEPKPENWGQQAISIQPLSYGWMPTLVNAQQQFQPPVMTGPALGSLIISPADMPAVTTPKDWKAALRGLRWPWAAQGA